jgi:cytochrome c biogenesis protein CcmG/thiol:disulfide interchange protein DsbE
MAKQKLVPIIGLNYKDKDPLAIEWLSKMGDPYQLSIVDKLGQVGINYGVYGVPETFVIDKNGIIKYKFTGPLTATAVQKELLPLLAKLNQ